MSHPYANEFSPRHHLREVIKRLVDWKPVCPCGNSKEFLLEEGIKTEPSNEQDGIVSTCDVYTCKCGRKWESAFSLTYAMCVLVEPE